MWQWKKIQAVPWKIKILEKTGIAVDFMAGYEEFIWGRNRDKKYFVKS